MVREEKRRIPEAAQPVSEAVGVPRQNGRQVDRIGKAAGNRAPRMQRQRICSEECGGDEHEERQHGADGA